MDTAGDSENDTTSPWNAGSANTIFSPETTLTEEGEYERAEGGAIRQPEMSISPKAPFVQRRVAVPTKFSGQAFSEVATTPLAVCGKESSAAQKLSATVMASVHVLVSTMF